MGYGFGQGVADSGFTEQIGCADCGFRFHPVMGERSDDGEMAEAEVGHGAGSGADIQRVAWGNQEDFEAVGLG